MWHRSPPLISPSSSCPHACALRLRVDALRPLNPGATHQVLRMGGQQRDVDERRQVARLQQRAQGRQRGGAGAGHQRRQKQRRLGAQAAHQQQPRLRHDAEGSSGQIFRL